MPKANLTQYTLLGLLNMRPRTGYGIKRFVADTMGHFWNESQRWVYVTLDQLDSDGLVTGRSDDHGERERVVYRITKKGQAALRAWLGEPPQPLEVRDELLLKVMLGGTRHVQRHRQEMLDRHRAISKAQDALPEMDVDAATRRQLGLTLDLGRRVTAAHLAWCDDTLKAPRGRRR